MKEISFAGLLQNERDMDAAYQQNAAESQRRGAFETFFEGLGTPPDLAALRTFVKDSNNMHDYRGADLMQVFAAFRAQEAYADMISLYEKSDCLSFINSDIATESYAVACNKTGQYNKTIKEGNYLLEHGDTNGEVYGTMGGAYRRKYEAAISYQYALQSNYLTPDKLAKLKENYVSAFPADPKAQRVEKNARLTLVRARNYYRAGFFQAFENYPGIKAVFCMMELKDFDRMKKMARLVYLACLRDGSRDTMDAHCAATMLEAACFMGASEHQMATTMKAFLKLNMSRTQLNKVSEHLARIRYRLALNGQDTKIFDEVRFKLDDVMEHMGRSAFNVAAAPPPEATVASVLKKNSFNYRGMASGFTGANFVRGNFKLGGQLPDHSLSRSDWKQFENVLNTPLAKLAGADEAKDHPPTMMEITDPEEFIQVAEKLIRRAFGTDEKNLEDMGGAGHHKYAEQVLGLIKLSGVQGQEIMDSRTNISVSMGIGLGDCRHHSQALQIMFDAWQKKHMNDALRNAAAAIDADDKGMYQQSIDEFKEIESVELRTMDVDVRAPIQMHGYYTPKKDKDGYAIAEEDGQTHFVEEHTLNVLMRYNKDGSLKNLRFADSFYQNHYKFGNNEVPVDQLKIDAAGIMTIPANTIASVDPATGKNVNLPVELSPTVYAGKRDETATDEHGRLLLLGIPVEASFDLVSKLTQPRGQMQAILERVRSWSKGEWAPPPVSPRKKPKLLSARAG